MSKLSLPSVTLFCADCVDVDRAVASIEKCKSQVDFGAVKFMTSLPTEYPHVEIPALRSLVHYSIWMLKNCHLYVDTEHLLVCQHDAWIINAETWDPAWLSYDYIAPLFTQYAMMGSGGFSLRTKKMMKFISDNTPPWDGTQEHAEKTVQPAVGAYEDGVVSIGLRSQAEANGFKYAPIWEANKFAQGGNPDPIHHIAKPFGFHREGRIGLTSDLL